MSGRGTRLSLFALAFAVIVALLGGARAGASGASPVSSEPRAPKAAASAVLVVAQVPAAALPTEARGDGTLRAPLGEGGRLVLVSGGKARVLTAGFDSAADPDVSFDGTAILFAGKKQKSDPWCVWEMRADGSGERKISCGKAGARQPVYQSTIYTITATNVEPWVQVAFVGEDAGEIDEKGAATNTSLWTVKTDGTALRRISFNLSNDMDPVILPDGRLVYASWLAHAARDGESGRVALVGINGDGTDAQLYAAHDGGRVKQMPAPTRGGLVVFVEADAIAADGAGRLAAVSQMRPLHSYRALTSDADGLFRAPAPLPDGRVLVSWRPRDGSAPYAVYRFDPASRTKELAFQDPAWQSVQAKLVAARPVPDARSSVVREEDQQGKLFAIDVNLHDLGEKLPSGAAKRLRVVEGVPSASRPPTRRVLGTIPLAEDGSFQVQVPANTPVQLQLLDESGLALRTSAWLWVRNHAAQGCVGCHEDPERTPPNRFVKALQVPAPVLDAPAEKRRAAGFAVDVQPVVVARCTSCHGEGGQARRLEATAAGLAPFVTHGEARRSPLLWHLLGRNTARPWDREAGAPGPAPMPGANALTPDEIRAFVEWIDLGGQP